MKRIEAEKNELVLQNESGDYAIIPANRRAEVQKLLDEGCYDCIDKIVSELPAMADYANEGTVVSDPPSNDPPSNDLIPNLLNVIGKLESSDNYDVTVGMKKNPNLVNMTINEVIDYSRSLGNSGAAGRYQIIPGTLEGLRNKGYVKGDDVFNPETQDKLAVELIKGRGLNKYLQGKLTADEFADNLSQEWAGLPYNTDKSYWAGVGNNKSLMSRKDFMSTVFGVTGQAQPPKAENTIVESPKRMEIKQQMADISASPSPSLGVSPKSAKEEQPSIPKEVKAMIKSSMVMQQYIMFDWQDITADTLKAFILANKQKFPQVPTDSAYLTKLATALNSK